MTNDSNSKFYWIIGGIVSLLGIGVFIAVVIAGVGLYLYSTNGDSNKAASKEPKQRRAPKTERRVKDIANKTPLPTASEKESQQFIEFIKEKYSIFGSFRLAEAKPFKSRLFTEADFTVAAIYTETKSKSTLSHLFIRYDDWDTARAEAKRRIEEFRKDDSKLKPKITKNRILAIVIADDRLNRLDCRKRKRAGTCDFVSSKDPDQLLRYIKLYFK